MLPAIQNCPEVGVNPIDWTLWRWIGEFVRWTGPLLFDTGVSLQHRTRDDRQREAGASAALPGAGHDEGGDRPAGGGEPGRDISLDQDREVDEEAVRYGPRPPVPSKLDPYKAIIEARLAKYPS